MLKLLILTHAHFDHAGSARKLKELTGCKILVHQSETEPAQKGLYPHSARNPLEGKAAGGTGQDLCPENHEVSRDRTGSCGR